MKTSFKALCAGALLGLASFVPAHAADFILINTDPAGVGFNDPAPATPVGGNRGTTVGEQRLIAYSRALQIWGSVLKSDVPIPVLGSFAPLGCTATGGTLAQAGAWNIELDFPNAPLANTLYHGALANSLAGFDLYVGSPTAPDGTAQDPIIDGADIVANFNGNLGKPGCLEGSTWYYGLDSNAGPAQIDFLNVFMHELSHGLGFSNFVSESSGQRLAGFNDVYMANTRDNFTGKLWTQLLTPLEIRQAAVRDGQQVWVGPRVTARAPLVLGPATLLNVDSPAAVAGEYDFIGNASFGVPATSANMTGDVVAGSPVDACAPLTNAAAVAGKIAIVRRGTCTFTAKAKNAQLAGAVGVIIANNAPGTGPIGLGGSDATVVIPAISVGTSAGDALIAAGAFHSAGFVVSATRLAGTDANGFVRLYAPNPVQQGSSGSHFDVVAEPSLLMEPAITPALEASHDVDLTVALFEDIGWKTEISLANCGAGSGSSATDLTGEVYAAPIFFCADSARNKGAFMSCSAHALSALVRAGVISSATKDVLVGCAANGGK